MKIGVKVFSFKNYWKETISELSTKYPDVDFEIYNKENIADYELLVTGFLKPNIIKEAKKLKGILVPFTGINGLPIKELLDKDIKVCNSHAKAETIAEKALGLTLSVLGKTAYYDREMRKGKWHGLNAGETSGGWNTLFEKKIGIYGMGNIGKNIVNLLKPFKCKIYTIDRGKKIENVDYFVNDVYELADKTDILFVCVPATKKTIGSINKQIIDSLKDGYIVNVARGNVIDEEALYYGLKNNVLAGAGIDTWYLYPREKKEQYPSKYSIHQLENVVLSPHVAGDSIENGYDNSNDAKRQLIKYIESKELPDAVDLKKYL